MRNVKTLIDHGATIRSDEGKAAHRWPRLALVGRLWSASGTLAIVVCLSVVLGALAVTAFAAEQRCGELGANCVCSEPFNTTSYTRTFDGSAYYWNPSDTTTKECTVESIPSSPIYTYGDLFGSNDATAMSRLPSGHTNSYFAARPVGATGTWWVGGGPSLGSSFMKRASIRFYTYHAPDYAFRYDNGDIGCHSKFLQGTGSWHWENYEGYIHQYEFTRAGWGTAAAPNPFPMDCCSGAPGVTHIMSKNDWRGHWFRVEAVVINRAGGATPNGVRHILYMQDVTNGVTKVNGGAEFVASDWFGAAGGWTGLQDITSNPAQSVMVVNYYREFHGNCAGFRGISHMMIAGWDTDAGQRIGPAVEVEGGGGPLDAPTNLLITP
jgi:hypothetical protein